MSDTIERDLVNAHGDALVSHEEDDYHKRYKGLFGAELTALGSLFELSELLYRFLNRSVLIRAEFRANLKADLVAEMHQQRANQQRRALRWAAYGASVAVASVIAAAGWRAVQARGRFPLSR
jgi:hypothetical protein